MYTFFVKHDFKKIKIEILVSTKSYISKCGAKDDYLMNWLENCKAGLINQGNYPIMVQFLEFHQLNHVMLA